MKSRIIWALVVIAAMCGFYFTTIRPAMDSKARNIRLPNLAEFRPPTVDLPPMPTPVMEMPTVALPALPPLALAPLERVSDRPVAKQEVPIQDGTTIDFSFGAPMVRSQGKDAEAMEKALKEMAEATKGTAFPGKK
jgi:hypothetical protein